MRFNKYGRFHGAFGADDTQVSQAASSTPQPGPNAISNPSLFASMSQQLTNYENQLIDIYNQKTKLVADRELARFHYLSAWRAQLESIIQGILNDVTQSTNSLALNQVTNFLGKLKSTIPMVTLDGYNILNSGNGGLNQGYQTGATGSFTPVVDSTNPSGTKLVGLMNPLDDLLTALTQNGTQPVYILMKGTFTNSNFNPFQPYINPFQVDWQCYDTNGIESAPFDNNALTCFTDYSGNPVIQFMNNAGTYQAGTLPDQFNATVQAQILGFFAKTYSQGDLNSTLAQGLALMTDLFQKTLNIITLQYNIDDLENTVAQFIQNAKTSGVMDPAIDSSAVFKNLQNLASQFNTAATLQTVSAAQLAQTPEPGAPTPTTAPQSSSGLWMALAAGALVLLGGGKGK